MRGRDLLAPFGVGALAVICCAGLPAVLALLGGITVVGLLGGGVGLAVLAGFAGAFVVRARRRRACAPPALAQVVDRTEREVTERVDEWPNVERDDRRRVVGFSGLTLGASSHGFRVGGSQLYAWCAWDTLFLPSLLDETARVSSKCAVTGASVELVVSPRDVQSTSPGELYVTFPALAGLDTGDIRRSFCCGVLFLAGAEAAHSWERTHAGGMVLSVNAAQELGRRTVAPLLEPALAPRF